MCAGKGTICRNIKKLAYENHIALEIIELDYLGHLILLQHDVKDQLVRVFGEGILGGDGEIKRSALAEKAFVSPDSIRTLNSITHNAIGQELELRIGKSSESGSFVIVESPLPVRMQPMFSHIDGMIVTIGASEDERLQRALAQGYSKDDALARFVAQPESNIYTDEADLVVENDNLDDVADIAWQIFNQLIAPKGASND